MVMAVLFLEAALAFLLAGRFIRETADAMVVRELAAHDAFWAAVRANA